MTVKINFSSVVFCGASGPTYGSGSEFGMTWLGGSNLSLSSDGIAVYIRPPKAHGRDTLPQPPSRLPPLGRNFERLGWIFGDCFDDGVW